MKCPKCGHELKEDHLICEICGEEIQIVPDFEPEIENSITETLSTLAALQEGEATEEITRENDATEEKQIHQPNKPSESGKKIWVIASLITIFVVGMASYGAYAYHIRTMDYQINQAREYAENGAYTEAIACLENAYERYPNEAQILFMEADYYYLQQDNDSAAKVLYRIIERGDFPYEDLEEAYSKIVAIYANQGLYGQINELLRNCPETEIVAMFQSYLPEEPEFSYVEGSYDEVIPLKLSSDAAGTIYYTMDGTAPTKDSLIYTAPLFLQSGEYTISAIFVNDYGIESEIVTKTYSISLPVPSPPEIELYSGEYTEPMRISVEEIEGCKVYYTTDGSDPTADSVPYTGPIPMPLGTMTFKFVNISDEAVSSEVTVRTYTLTLRDAIPTEQAVTNLVNRLVEIGYLEDTEGHNNRQSGTLSYRFSSVLRIGKADDYYTINEYVDDGAGVPIRTDKVFLVNIHTGEVWRLAYDDNGDFTAVSP